MLRGGVGSSVGDEIGVVDPGNPGSGGNVGEGRLGGNGVGVYNGGVGR